MPADRADRVDQALASRTHAVIVDLEDGVAPAAKDAARANLQLLLGRAHDKPVFVRIERAADVELVAGLAIHGIVVPKAERPDQLPSGIAVHALIETPLGVENAFAIASHSSVRGLMLGEADLGSRTGATDHDWARARVINAAVAAGLPRPPQAPYLRLHDLAGLAESCRRGRELGHLGRAAIHPDQLPVIEQAYLPTTDEVERARATVARLAADGVGTVGDDFVDAAMLGAAEQVLALAERYGVAG